MDGLYEQYFATAPPPSVAAGEHERAADQRLERGAVTRQE